MAEADSSFPSVRGSKRRRRRGALKGAALTTGLRKPMPAVGRNKHQHYDPITGRKINHDSTPEAQD